MNKDILKGILLTLGILSLFGIVFAVGFHTASEITSGTFSGDYEVTGSFKLNNAAANCDITKEGALKYNNSIVQVCNGTNWNDLSATSSTGIGGIDAFTKLMLHFDGTWTDSSIYGRSVNPIDNANTGSSGRFSNALSLDGAGDYITLPDSTDWQFGTDPFTIDMWVKWNSIGNTNGDSEILVGQDDFSGTRHWMLYLYNDAGTSKLKFLYTDPAFLTLEADWLPSLNTWYHVAFVRESATVSKFYVNGNQIGVTGTANYNIEDSSNPLYIGNHNYAGSLDRDFDGYMDEIRISKGIARWTSNFPTPTAPYSN